MRARACNYLFTRCSLFRFYFSLSFFSLSLSRKTADYPRTSSKTCGSDGFQDANTNDGFIFLGHLSETLESLSPSKRADLDDHRISSLCLGATVLYVFFLSILHFQFVTFDSFSLSLSLANREGRRRLEDGCENVHLFVVKLFFAIALLRAITNDYD